MEKDWLAFGHPFSERAGLPNSPRSSLTPEMNRQSSSANVATSPMRISSGSGSTSSSVSHSQTSSNVSPIFLQVLSIENDDLFLKIFYGISNCDNFIEINQRLVDRIMWALNVERSSYIVPESAGTQLFFPCIMHLIRKNPEILLKNQKNLCFINILCVAVLHGSVIHPNVSLEIEHPFSTRLINGRSPFS